MYNDETTQMNDKAYTFINLGYMDMMSDGDNDMKKIMLEMLLEEIPIELQKMRDQIGPANWTEMASISHKMKSTLAFVGNDTMTNANKEIEHISKDQVDTDNIPALIDTLDNTYANVVTELKKALEAL